MKWKLSLPEPLVLVYYYVKLIGLAPFTIKKNRFCPPNLLGKLYSVSLAATYIFGAQAALSSMFKILEAVEITKIVYMEFVMKILSTALATFSTPILSVLMYEKILYVMNKLADISNELKSLDIEENLGKFSKNVLRTTVIANVILAATAVALYFVERSTWPTSITIKNITDCWIYFNVVLMFAQILFFIRQLFKLVNEKLYSVFRQAYNCRSLHHLHVLVGCRNPREETNSGIEDMTNLQRMRKVRALHLELCNLVNRTANLFAIPIILKTLGFTFELMGNSFWMYKLIMNLGQSHSTAEAVSYAVNILNALLTIVIINVGLFAVAYVSVKTCEEGNAMEGVLFKLWYKFKPRDLKNEFVMFSLQMMQKPVAVSIFGYFDLDYSYIYKIFCVVVAYTIIMIQFDISQLNTGT